MQNKIIKCPCCEQNLLIQISDDGEITIVPFIENIDVNELRKKLEENGIEFG